MLQALWSQDPPAHHPSLGCGCPPFRHRSVVRMHTIFSLLASSTMPPPPPQHKELFSLRQPDWIHEISHWGGEANPGPTWPTCQDSTRSRKWLNEEGQTHGEEEQRELCPAAHLPSALLSPSSGQGASTTYWSLCWDQEHTGGKTDESPSQNTPSASGKLKKKKKKKKSANKQKTCKSYWANKHRLREALPTQAGVSQ